MEHVRNFVKKLDDMLLIEGIINRCPADMDTYVDAPNPDNPEIHGFYTNWEGYKTKTYDELKELPCYNQPKFKIQMLLNAVHGNPLKVGDKVKLDNEKIFLWTVRAVREEYSILTTAGEKGKYTILDHIEGIRGPDNCYGIGYTTDDDCENAILALFDEQPDGVSIEISYRYRVPLVIAEIKHKKEDRIVSLINRIGITELEAIIDCPDDAIYFVDEYNDHFKKHGYCTDKFIVGVSNKSTHYKLEDVRRKLSEVKHA